jgi:hypothetical protein
VSEAPDGIASIALHFGAGAAIGEGAQDGALAVAGMPRRRPQPQIFMFTIPPTPLLTTGVGTFAILSSTVGIPSGWVWDITSLSVQGFSAGAVAVTKAAPAVTAAGTPVAIEQVALFAVAGVQNFPTQGNPLLDANDDLYFTVTGALTAPNGVIISGTAIAVPVSRLDKYLS